MLQCDQPAEGLRFETPDSHSKHISVHLELKLLEFSPRGLPVPHLLLQHPEAAVHSAGKSGLFEVMHRAS